MTEHDPLAVALALVLILAVLAVAFPWWSVDASGFGGTMTMEAAPFRSDDVPLRDEPLVPTNEVWLVGSLAIVQVGASLWGLVLTLRREEEDDGERLRAPGAWAVGGAVAGLLAIVLAVLLWPGGDLGFMDSAEGFGLTLVSSPAAGWWLALVACLVGGIMGARSLAEEPRAASAPTN